MSKLAGYENDVQTLCDQQRGEAVAQGVQREPSAGGNAVALDGGVGRLAYASVLAGEARTIVAQRCPSNPDRRTSILQLEVVVSPNCQETPDGSDEGLGDGDGNGLQGCWLLFAAIHPAERRRDGVARAPFRSLHRQGRKT